MTTNLTYSYFYVTLSNMSPDRLKEYGQVALRTGASLLLLASTSSPQSVRAKEAVILAPPEGSVTPGAFGQLGVEVVSRNPRNDLVELKINGDLTGLVPSRVYRVWACWPDKYTCGTDTKPEIMTNIDGSASFTDLTIFMFDREDRRISSFQVKQETSGLIPDDACYVGAIPCLRAPYTVPSVVR